MTAWPAVALLSLALLCLYLAARVAGLKRALRRSTHALAAPGAQEAPSPAELSLAAMIEELEAKEKAILENLAEREAAIIALLGASPAVSPRTGGPAPGGVPATLAADRSPAVGPSSPRAAAVRELAAQGLGVEEIARRLSLGKGEVQLILHLWR